MSRYKVTKIFQEAVCIVTGNALLAFLVAAFVIPHDLIMGGATGIGILIGKLLPVDTALAVFVLNIILLLVGLLVLGKQFFFKTAVSSVLYPALLALMQRIPQIENLTDNSVIAVLFAGGLMGISSGLVFRVGASTGGTDVLNLILHKYFHLPVALFVYIVDLAIVGSQAFYSSSNGVLLGIVLLVIEALVLDRVMIFGKSQIQLFIISKKYEDIRKILLTDLEAGVTMTVIETGRLRVKSQAVLCVIPPRKLYSAGELVRKADPDAFVTVTKIKEVTGQGFTHDRRFIKPD